MSDQSNIKRIRNRALLGTAAAVLLGGAIAGEAVLLPKTPAYADAVHVEGVQPVSFADVVEKVRPAVVSVKVKVSEPEVASDSDQRRQFRNWPDNFNVPEWFKDMFPDRGMPDPFHGPSPRGQRRALAQGSGFIISEDGYVVTNNHVVDNASEVELTLDDGSVYTAKIVGTDKKTDLALLKIDASREFPYVAFTDDDIEIGDWVLAVGNPFGLGGSVTVGVVSARGRDIGAGLYDDFIQVDAPINKGNSGGPTFNLKGQVVGINTAIYSPSGGSVGIGFAIPAEVAKGVIAQLRDTGSVSRGWLGVQIQPVTRDIADSLGLKDAAGALVSDVQNGSPAQAAGMKLGDVILEVDGREVKDAKDLARKIGAHNPEERTAIKILRDGKPQTLSVKLGRQKEEKQASVSPEPAKEMAVNQLGLALRAAAQVPDAGDEGVVVVGVADGSEAADKGLETGDVILKVDNRDVSTPEDVARIISEVTQAKRAKVLLFVKSSKGQHFVALDLDAA